MVNITLPQFYIELGLYLLTTHTLIPPKFGQIGQITLLENQQLKAPTLNFNKTVHS